MRHNNLVFSIAALLLFGGASLYAQCPAFATAGQPVSFQLTAVDSGNNPLPDDPSYFWFTNPDTLTATPSNGNHITNIGGIVPLNAPAGPLTVTITYNFSGPVYTFTCTIQVVTAFLQINGTCPSNAYAPGDTLSVPFSASGGTTQQFVWSSPPGPFTPSPAIGATTSETGTVPGSNTSFTLLLSETGANASPPVSITCSITVIPPNNPLHLMGACPGNPVVPGPLSVPFSATGGNTHLYRWILSGPFGLTSNTGPNTAVQGVVTGATSFRLILAEDPIMNSSIVPALPVSITCSIEVPIAPLKIIGTCPTSLLPQGVSANVPLLAQGGVAPYHWQLNPINIGLALTSAANPATTVFGLPFGQGSTFNFTVTLTDSADDSTTFNCSITIATALNISGVCPAQQLVAGSPLSLPLTASGGIPPYVWTVGEGPFTASSNTGTTITVGGTPATPGDYVLNVYLTDSQRSPIATFSCTIHVVSAFPPLTITGTPACPVDAVLGIPATIPLSAAGGSGKYTWLLTGPSFLSLTSSSGASTSVTGFSTTAGSFPFTVTLADDSKTPLAAPLSCSVQVSTLLNLQLSGTFPDGIVNEAYVSPRVTATGGLPPLTISVSKGSLPPGLTFDPASGLVTGTPTQAGTFPFTLTVTDSGTGAGHQSVSADLTINIYAVLQNTTSCPLPTGQEAQPYNASLTATGGTGQYVFSLTGGSTLPPGLSLNQNAITGTPSGPFAVSTLNFQVVSGSQTQSFGCAISVLGRKPSVTVSGSLGTSGSLINPTVTLDTPVQEDVSGTAVLSFTPDVPNASVTDNPQVQFCSGNASDPLCSGVKKDANGLLRLVIFTIKAGSSSLSLPPVLTSNVAGLIQISLTNLTVGSQSLTAPPLKLTIPRTAPVILGTPQAALNGDTLQITVKVSSSTCELTSANAVFTAAPGSQVAGLSATIDLRSLFQNFTPFAVDSAHPTGGCAFSLTLPFTIAGSANAVSSVNVTLTSTAGSTSGTASVP